MKTLKRIAYGAVALCMFILAACSSDRTADVRVLLESVPSDASLVAVIDVKSLLEDADCKVTGDKIIPGKEMLKALKNSDNSKLETLIEDNQDLGLDPSVAVYFMEGYNTYVTGYLSDSDKFKEYIEEKFREKFQNAGDVSTCGNIAVTGDRFWICASSRNTISSGDIKHFQSLSGKQSILSNEVVAKLEKLDHEVQGWGDIKGCLSSQFIPFSSRAMITMAVETIFSDAVEFIWHIDFEKGEAEAEAEILNSKGGIAKFNFPESKIDGATIRSFGGSATGYVAAAISPEIIKTLQEETGGKGLSVIGMVSKILSCVDGTCVVALGKDIEGGMISTNGHDTADLTGMLSQFGFRVSKEGKFLRFAKGETTGDIPAEETADELKDALAGGVVSVADMGGDKTGISKVSVRLIPEKGGVKLNLKVKGTASKENLLFSVLKNTLESY